MAKYKDDVELERTRKTRKRLSEAIISMVIGILITAGGVIVFGQMKKVIGWYQ